MDKANPSDAEFEILKVIWSYGKASVSQIHKEIVEQRNSPITRNTVQVQVKRLLVKGKLNREKIDENYFYSATETEDESCRKIALDIKQRVFGGSVSNLVKCLFKGDEISNQELSELEEFMRKSKKGES